MTWIIFWKVLFIGIMTVFTVMSVLVAVLGARDIRRLLAGLRVDADASTRANADADPEKSARNVDESDRE